MRLILDDNIIEPKLESLRRARIYKIGKLPE